MNKNFFSASRLAGLPRKGALIAGMATALAVVGVGAAFAATGAPAPASPAPAATLSASPAPVSPAAVAPAPVIAPEAVTPDADQTGTVTEPSHQKEEATSKDTNEVEATEPNGSDNNDQSAVEEQSEPTDVGDADNGPAVGGQAKDTGDKKDDSAAKPAESGQGD
jgi:hypothetical protein